MKPSRGYTLLEMLVVVAILGLATSLVAPAGYRMVASWNEATEVDQVLHALEALPVRARNEGRQFELEQIGAAASPADAGNADAALPGTPTPSPAPLELPEGWRMEFSPALQIRANGACAETSGVLHTRRQALPFTVQAPFCRIRRQPAQAS